MAGEIVTNPVTIIQNGAANTSSNPIFVSESGSASAAAIGTTADPLVADPTNNTTAATLIALTKGFLKGIGQVADTAWTTGSGSVIALLKAIAGAAISTDPVQVYSAGLGANITSNTTTVVKSGAGTFYGVAWNALGTTEVLTIYDNTAGSGTKIGTQSGVAATGFQGMGPGVAFGTGLTIVSSGAAAGDWTVVSR